MIKNLIGEVKTVKMIEIPKLKLSNLGGGQIKIHGDDQDDLIVQLKADAIIPILYSILGEDFLISPCQTCELLGMSYPTLMKLVNNGDLIAFGASKRNEFKLGHVIRFMLDGESMSKEEREAFLALADEPEAETEE